MIVKTYVVTVTEVMSLASAGWVAKCAEFPGCVAKGGTQAEAIANIQKVISDHVTKQVKGGKA